MDHFWKIELLGQAVHLNTLIMVWAGMAVLLVFAWLATRNLQLVPSRLQLVGEGFYNLVRGMTYSSSGKEGDKYLFIVGSLFLFVLTANLMGQLPLRLVHIPHGELIAATGDINTTLALALVTLVSYLVLSCKRLGFGGFLNHHMEPKIFGLPLMLPFHLLDHITRPGSLMLRLYANILVGEMLGAIALQFVPIGLPVLIIFMEIGVGVLQAYIFALLSTIYIGLMTSHGEDHH
ncbi:MAG: F0F1 ATP synthase subunit A [Vampirovibrionales bacterium]|nr:F0F1 ATP synthase subunit A [Vampirovibrionales bacterium]